jgi:NAD(P)-dependent dehydrogenase (short-subunit alcohol dehydrogenase family)
MPKTILITGATDGIGLLTAKMLADQGHQILLHGRDAAKLATAQAEVGGDSRTYQADLARLADVMALARAVTADVTQLDVLINNAGVLKATNPRTADGMDLRYMVNTLAPYALTRELLPLIPTDGRIVNLSSAAQAPVSSDALTRGGAMSDMEAYAQSKLAITIWSQEMAKEMQDGPVVVSVNPGSLLATKMVKEGFGIAGNDLSIGADILCAAALSDTFSDVSGQYYDNDAGRFAPPHAMAADAAHVGQVMQGIASALTALGYPSK